MVADVMEIDVGSGDCHGVFGLGNFNSKVYKLKTLLMYQPIAKAKA
jgi:hypothetical protein